MRGRAQLGLACGLVLAAGLAACGESFEVAARKLEGGADVTGRVSAAARLGEIGGEDAVRILTLHGLRDPAARVRAAAVDALVVQDNHVSYDLLADLLEDPAPLVQVAAARALARRGGAAARRYLEAGYAAAGSEGRAAIAAALEATGGDPEAAVRAAADRRLEINLRALKTGRPWERIGAAEELGRSGRPGAVSALLPLLASRSVDLSAAAARGLGWSGAGQAVEALARVVQEPYPQLQSAAAAALAALGHPGGVAGLQAALEGAAPALASELAAALGGLARQGVPEAAAALCAVAGATDSPSRAAAVGRELHALGAPCEVAEAVSRRLGGRASEALPALRLVAALGPQALDETGRTRLAALLGAADGDLAAAAWEAAAAARLQETGPAALEALEAAVARDRRDRTEWIPDRLPDDPDWGVVALPSGEGEGEAAAVLARHGELVERVARWEAGRAGPPHPDAAADPDRIELVPELDPGRTRLLATLAEASGALAGEPAVERVTPLLTHPDPEVRLGAVRGLSAVDASASTAALLQVVGADQPPRVLAAAAGVLADRHVGADRVVAALEHLPQEALPAAARALGRLGGEEARFALAGLLDTPAAPEAIRALGRIGGRDAARTVADHLLAAPASGEVAAVEVLAELGDGPEVGELLARALHDVRPEVRAAAAAAMRRLGQSDPWLDALVQDYDRRVRMAARPPSAQ